MQEPRKGGLVGVKVSSPLLSQKMASYTTITSQYLRHRTGRTRAVAEDCNRSKSKLHIQVFAILLVIQIDVLHVVLIFCTEQRNLNVAKTPLKQLSKPIKTNIT